MTLPSPSQNDDSSTTETDYSTLWPIHFEANEGEICCSADDLEASRHHFLRLRSFLLSMVAAADSVTCNDDGNNTNANAYTYTKDLMLSLVEDYQHGMKHKCVAVIRSQQFLQELVRSGQSGGSGQRHQQQQQQHLAADTNIALNYHRQKAGQQDAANEHSFALFLHEKPLIALPTLSVAIGSAMYAFTGRKATTTTCATGVAGVRTSELQDIKIITRMLPTATSYSITSSKNKIPLIRMSDIKTNLVHKFISLKGHVTKCRPKRLRVLSSDFQCAKCGEQLRHRFVDGRYSTPSRCVGIKCRSRTFTILRSTATYVDYQQLRLQELQDETQTDAGRTPRQVDVEVTDADMVDLCNAGDVVLVSGVVMSINTALASGKSGRKAMETSTYKLFIKANSIVNHTAEARRSHRQRSQIMSGGSNGNKDGSSNNNRENTSVSFSPDQLSMIAKLAHFDPIAGTIIERQAFPFDMLVRSLCPSIIGHELVKAGLLLALLGGTPSASGGLEGRGPTTIRSNSHLLIVGDPGMGKSQMLLAASQIATRSVYVGGNTSSTTGLTVSLSKEAGGEVGIEAGALVLADQGVCAIDEFDKMAKAQQDGLLEAMEQQQISIAKAGVVASLPARCSVIAAANPKSGNYNKGKTVGENINMSSPLLSRFDLVFVLQDTANNSQDKMVSRNIMNLYRQHQQYTNTTSYDAWLSSSSAEAPILEVCELEERLRKVSLEQNNPLPPDLVKDYIAYAREYCRPKLTQKAAAILRDYFLERRSSNRGDQVPITTRQLEALIRLSQARAKACLREFVLPEDSLDVVQLMTQSVHQVHTDELGVVDKTRGGAGGKSKRKVKRLFLEKLHAYSHNQGLRELTMDDLRRVADHAACPLSDFEALVDELRCHGDLIKTPSNTFKIIR